MQSTVSSANGSFRASAMYSVAIPFVQDGSIITSFIVKYLTRQSTCYNHCMDISTETLAYLAGALDSDGHFSIKRTTYHMRVRGDANAPVFEEVIGLKQTCSSVPDLLKGMFRRLALHAKSCDT